MSEEKDPKDGKQGTEEPFLGSWKTKEDAAEGLKNLQSKLSDQGSEAGTLRKQVEDGQLLMDEMQTKLTAAEKAGEERASDQDKNTVKSEQDKINQQITDLDPVDDDYSKKLMTLMGKSNVIIRNAYLKI